MAPATSPNPEQCAIFLKALADPTRLRIVNALKAGSLTVGDVALALNLEMALVSHHLRSLYHASIAVTEKDGKYVYYSLNRKIFSIRGEGKTLDFGCCKFQLNGWTLDPT